MTHPALAAVVVGLLTFNFISIFGLWWAVLKLERMAHPPIDLTPAVIDILKSLKVICDRPKDGWYCTQKYGHYGRCAAYVIHPDN